MAEELKDETPNEGVSKEPSENVKVVNMTFYNVWQGKQPVRSIPDKALALSFARALRADGLNKGIDISDEEHAVNVYEVQKRVTVPV